MSKEWEQAVEIYRALFEVLPENRKESRVEAAKT